MYFPCLQRRFFKHYPFNESIVDNSIELEELKATYLETLENPDVDAERSYFTYWDIEKKEIIVVFGEDPGLREQVEDVIDEADIPF